MKKCSKIIVLFVLIILILAAYTTISKAEPNAELGTEDNPWNISATEDDNVKAWLSESGVLTIYGTGNMIDWYDYVKTPWQNKKSSIESIIIDTGVTSIGKYAFYECNQLTKVEISPSVKRIGLCAFAFSKSLEEIYIPESVVTIENLAFYYCYSLKQIDVQKGNKYYCGEEGILFSKGKSQLICYPIGKKDVKYIIPDTVSNITSNAFEGSCLKEIIIPENMTSIDGGAFRNCSYLEKIKIPEKVTSIGFSSFWGCKSLTEITIPENVTSIEEHAFYGCGLTKIDIPENVTTIGISAFESCANLKSIIIPSKITHIKSSTFYRCSGLESIIMPNGITEIGEYAFYNCKNLKYIIIPEKVNNIGNYAFDGCNKLEKLYAYCNTYGEEYITQNYAPKLEIIHKNLNVIKEPTCTECGEGKGICSECKNEKTSIIPPLGHSYAEHFYAASINQNGKIECKCIRCGKIRFTKPINYPKYICISNTSFNYNKKTQKPTARVKDSNGEEIDLSNYDIKYSNAKSKKVGEYSVTITFKGNKYTGEKTLTYTIIPKGTSILKLKTGKKMFNVTWKKQTTETTGYQIQYSTDKKFIKNNKKVNINKNKTTSKLIKKLKGKKKYYVRIRTYKKINGKKIYSSWSKVKNIKTKK